MIRPVGRQFWANYFHIQFAKIVSKMVGRLFSHPIAQIILMVGRLFSHPIAQIILMVGRLFSHPISQIILIVASKLLANAGEFEQHV